MATCVAKTGLSDVLGRGSFAVLVCAVCARTHAHKGSRDTTHDTDSVWPKIAFYGEVSPGVARDVSGHSVCTQ
jgi:hypothetical protein